MIHSHGMVFLFCFNQSPKFFFNFLKCKRADAIPSTYCLHSSCFFLIILYVRHYHVSLKFTSYVVRVKTTAVAMPTKSADDPVAIWGHILCQQLSLPVLNWRKAQRENYPFYREIVTPSVFAHSNPAAFQNILHFLFNTLDPVESAEKFVGLWPLHPGDKKAESQFR